MSAQKVSDRLYLSQVDVKTQTPGVYKKGMTYRVLTRPDGKRKVMRRFATYEEAVAFKRAQPARALRLLPNQSTTSAPARGRRESRELFLEHLRRDPCAYCGGLAGTIDHIVPVAGGGSNNWSNLTSACAACNSRKRAKPLLIFLAHEHGCWEWRKNLSHPVKESYD